VFFMKVDDVFAIKRRGVVATGRIARGTLRAGDVVYVDGGHTAEVVGIEMFRKKVDEASAGETVGVLFGDIDRSALSRGSVLSSDPHAPESATFTL
jgi:elongation factor Tu